MGPPSAARGRNQNQGKNKKVGNKKKQPQHWTGREDKHNNRKESTSDELSRSIPLPLYQLLLNIFRSALLFPTDPSEGHEKSWEKGEERTLDHTPLAITPLIQTLKTHLYNRDFISAFADANEDLLRAYALRWSAGRALGYVGVLDGVWRNWVAPVNKKKGERGKIIRHHAVCIGGGAGAEIVALAGVWRMLKDEGDLGGGDELGDTASNVEKNISKLSIHDRCTDSVEQEGITVPSSKTTSGSNNLLITAVDIADWSPVVERLSRTIGSPSVPSTKSCRAPLLASDNSGSVGFNVTFKHLDVLSLSDEELQSLFYPEANQASKPQDHPTSTHLVTLMFTLNELFSTSIPKATSFLLRMTDLLEPGTVLLVVDSPGSYSTVSLGKKEDTDSPSSSSPSNAKEERAPSGSAAPSQHQKPRSYPMRFLLDHALLSVASGSWECVLSEDSRWFRREAPKLSYDVGEGIGLEDMRFQVHVYRRLKG